ncbi:hypothetical protein [Aquimarina sp. 2201CG5-10]|uniref:hypothetical protein n=1 Tax=Aquimarina callyspongiae TaxID=3098150 RepID=UPI002AB42441|nr:hypothetical protein [Aquimarina sp. 2201CG5-10]MDY8138135.1 hypothetical protein [Aquimarina sp. 2201CG5-10]
MYWKSKEIIDKLSNDNDIDTLPLAHNTCFYTFENILNDRAFRVEPAKKDEVFDIKKIFFFYGVPAYIGDHAWPSIFVFDNIKESFFSELDWSPIDSGAYRIVKEKSIFNCFRTISQDTFEDAFVLKRGAGENKTLSYLKSHIKNFFKDNYNYYQGNCDLPKNESEDIEFSTIKDFFKSLDSFDKINCKQEVLEEYTKIDRRAKIIEGSTKIDLPIAMLELVACYIPKSKKQDVMDYFNISKEKGEKIIETYLPSETGNPNDCIIEKGMKWVEKVTEKRLSKK